jgi:hypothetical protein
VAEWLKQFPTITCFSRDGSQTYAKAIRTALPNAAQVSDRFHLIKNLVEYSREYLNTFIPRVITVKREGENEIGIKGKMTAPERAAFANFKKKQRAFKKIKKLQAEGKKAAAIQSITGLSQHFVRKYMKSESIKPMAMFNTEKRSKLDPYKSLILQMIIDCKKTSVIKQAVTDAGFKGADSLIRMHISKVRRDGVDYVGEKLFRRDIFFPLYRSLDKMKDPVKRQKVQAYVDNEPKISEIIIMVSEFKTLLKSRDTTSLDQWMEKYKRLNNIYIDKFMSGIESDKEAIQNAIISKYSNGIAEGKINKIKTVKRIMYGRAGFELLTSKLFLLDNFN